MIFAQINIPNPARIMSLCKSPANLNNHKSMGLEIQYLLMLAN